VYGKISASKQVCSSTNLLKENGTYTHLASPGNLPAANATVAANLAANVPMEQKRSNFIEFYKNPTPLGVLGTDEISVGSFLCP
jgi:hypothetical protein